MPKVNVLLLVVSTVRLPDPTIVLAVSPVPVVLAIITWLALYAVLDTVPNTTVATFTVLVNLIVVGVARLTT